MQLSELSQERLVGRQRQSAQNCLLAALRFGRDRTSRISTRKSPEVGGLRGSIRDFGDYEDCVVADAVSVELWTQIIDPPRDQFHKFAVPTNLPTIREQTASGDVSGKLERFRVCPLLDQSGQRWILASDGLSAYDSRLNRSTQHFIVEEKIESVRR